MMDEICHSVIDGFVMTVEWALNIMVPIFKKVNIRNCTCYGATKLLEHRIKVVERILEKDHVE